MSNIKKTAIIITIISLGSKLLGFLREVLLAYFYGTSYIVDAYLMALSIPAIVFGWVTSLAVSYTPIFMDLRIKSGEDKALKFTNNIISIAVTISLFCALFGIVFSKQLVAIAAPGFEGEAYNLTNQFVKISVFSIAFTVVVQILTSYLNCNDKFILSNISTLVVSSTQLLVIFLSSKLGKEVLIYGTVLSNMVQLLVLYIFSSKNGFGFKYELSITPEIKKSFIILGPIFISSMLSQINAFVNKIFASGLVEGSISALNYSGILRTFIHYIFTVALTTLIYPMLSKSMAENDMTSVKKIVSKSINLVIILFIPMTVGAILLSKPAISFVYERGVFGSDSTAMTAIALQMYLLGLSAFALKDILTKVFYAMQDTKAVMYISILTVGSCIMLSIILVNPMKHAGLALATSLSEIVTLPLFFYYLRARLGGFGLKNSLSILIKSAVSSAMMGFAVFFIFRYLSSILSVGKIFTLLSMGISAATGAGIYLVLMILMKVEEMGIFTGLIKDVWGRFIH